MGSTGSSVKLEQEDALAAWGIARIVYGMTTESYGILKFTGSINVRTVGYDACEEDHSRIIAGL
ncbi:hypothetical protein D3C80_1590140 [compost metagenome]